jgi:diguanylate cyclase (GGDEF)-like protein
MLRTVLRSSLFRVDSGDARLSVAQFEALSRQIPVLYVLLIVNAAALSYTHHASAPALLSLYIPGALCGICLFRLIAWLLRTRSVPDAAFAVAKMRKTVVLAAILAVAFGAWAVSLYPYGDAYQQSHIAYFLSIAGISCIFCLMSLPPAALITTGLVFTILIANFISTGIPVFMAMSVSVFLVSFAFVRVIHSYFDNFSGLIQSTSELEQRQVETERLNIQTIRHANEDQLTGLANRRKFFDTLHQTLEANRGSRPPVIGLIDLDGFKPVNDVFGHAAGDHVLIEVAKRFRTILDKDCTIARMGGDEFGFLLPSHCSPQQALDIGNTLCAALKEHFVTPWGVAKLSGTCGIALNDDRFVKAHTLLEQADFALYEAKSRQTGGVEIFSDRHVRLLHERNAIERELQVADIRNELYLQFQPILSLKTDRIIGFEALGRWNNRTLGEIAPGAFIPVAERCGLINDVTLILLGKAIESLAEIPDHCRVSFNLSARDICNHVDALKVLSLVERSGVDPTRLEFEITETALLSNFDTAARMINLYRAAGIAISLDDFGTGYSSLSHVHRLDFDKIKIDRSFVQQMSADRRSRNIVKSVIDLADNMAISCVAEGVETPEIAQALVQMGCGFAQGYHFARPMPLAEALQCLSDDPFSTLKQLSA